MYIQRCKMMMKLFLLYIVVINMVITTAAVTTNNRILLSSVLVGTALAASVSESYDFSYTELALLTTAVLVINFPRNQPVQDSCTAPGYTADPLFGCYRLVKGGTTLVTKTEAIQGCASDGGRLQLINSEAEAKALTALIQNEGIVPPGTFIQGSRASISSPWVGDDGNPLPYLPSSVENGNVPIANLLWFKSDSPTAFTYSASDNTVTLTSYVCEI
ncbi:uncharacterized protein [Magallana gigas]|uniref:uncharacterized protein n=1 Tax=Magallana gigas TaxID=29159 RepID=UPI00333EA528